MPSRRSLSPPESIDEDALRGDIPVSLLLAQPALSEYVSTTGHMVGREPDQLVRHFGHPGEGYAGMNLHIDNVGSGSEV